MREAEVFQMSQKKISSNEQKYLVQMIAKK